jgi:hypothetical protein
MPIALQVSDVAVARERLKAKGVRFVRDTFDSGVCWQAIYLGPDGNPLSLTTATPWGTKAQPRRSPARPTARLVRLLSCPTRLHFRPTQELMTSALAAYTRRHERRSRHAKTTAASHLARPMSRPGRHAGRRLHRSVRSPGFPPMQESVLADSGKHVIALWTKEPSRTSRGGPPRCSFSSRAAVGASYKSCKRALFLPWHCARGRRRCLASGPSP